MKRFLNKYKCGLCNSNKSDYIYTHENLKYRQCKNCDLVFQERINDPNLKEKLKIEYNETYYKKNYTIASDDKYKRKIQYLLDKKLITKYFKDSSQKKILDYGFGNEIFIRLFKGKKYGFEFIQKEKYKKGFTFLKNNEIKKKKFDLIIMRGVVEHLPNFKEILNILTKSVKKNGFFFITATPNSSSLSFKLNNKKFNQNGPLHLVHFNHINLSKYFLKKNFFNLETTFQYYETPYQDYKKDFKNLKKNKKTHPPAVGNMLTMVFKKLA